MKSLTLLSIAFSASLLAACGASNGSGADGGESCASGETRCSGNAFQECSGGTFKDSVICAGTTVCSADLGCVACDPDQGNACVGDEVHLCNADGSLGDYRETCGEGLCFNGSCGQDACDASGVDLIYVVDDSNNLLSFNPANLGPGGEPFSMIGTLSCPAAPALPEIGDGDATPFSMSVDRGGTAWVLYSSGQVFHASTSDASCQNIGWQVGTEGFELFGMGFVADGPGAETETLYIAGGDAADINGGNLGTVHPVTKVVSTIGPLPPAEQSPELTGTGDGLLYGYFPGAFESFVANIDKSNASRGMSWDLPGLDGAATAWAFAHWGGRFYIFVTSGLFVPINEVYELDPATGESRVVVMNSPYTVVGAGVSTCAPTQID